MSESPPRPTDARSATLDDVARTAGVSRATASRVIGGSLHVSAQARQAVEQAIQELEYAPSPAPLDRPKACNCVGVVITEPATDLFGTWFFKQLLQGIYEALEERSLLMSLITPHSARDMLLAQAYLTSGHVDGVILASIHGDNPLPRCLIEAEVPFVVCSRPPKDVQASFVDCDNRRAGALGANHLISLGRRTIAMISGNLDMPSSVDRLMGYRDALTAAGMKLDPTLEEVGDYRADRAQMAMERLLLNHPDVDGVFAASDDMAVAAIRVLHQARRSVPEDVSVIGFDDTPISEICRPSLSSVRQPVEEMGRGTVGLLMRRIEKPDEAPRQVIFEADLVARESTVGEKSLRAVV